MWAEGELGLCSGVTEITPSQPGNGSFEPEDSSELPQPGDNVVRPLDPHVDQTLGEGYPGIEHGFG